MRKETIKRLILCVTGGMLFPLLYILLLFLVMTVFRFFNSVIYGDSIWAWLLLLPLDWSGQIYNYLFPPRFAKLYGLLRREVILMNIIASFLLYSILTYAGLWWRARPRWR